MAISKLSFTPAVKNEKGESVDVEFTPDAEFVARVDEKRVAKSYRFYESDIQRVARVVERLNASRRGPKRITETDVLRALFVLAENIEDEQLLTTIRSLD